MVVKYNKITTMKLYQDSLSIDAKIGAGVPLVGKFSMGAGYSDLKRKIENSDSVFLESVMRCIEFNPRLQENQGPKLSTDFLAAVEKIKSKEDAIEFVREFGTHFVKEFSMGAKAVLRTETDERSLKTLEERKVNIGLAVEATIKGISASGETTAGYQTKDEREFKSVMKDYTMVFHGSKPEPNGDFVKWAANVKENPYPIQYNLYPITKLFNAYYMPSISDQAGKAALVAQAYDLYCKETPVCEEPSAGICRLIVILLRKLSR